MFVLMFEVTFTPFGWDIAPLFPIIFPHIVAAPLSSLLSLDFSYFCVPVVCMLLDFTIHDSIAIVRINCNQEPQVA